MDNQTTPEEDEAYVIQLKRLSKIIQKRIVDELQKVKFLDIYPPVFFGSMDILLAIEDNFNLISEDLEVATVAVELENIIEELRGIEFQLQKDRFEKEQENNNIEYYEIALAKHLVRVNRSFPEDSMPHLPPGQSKQLPDTAGPLGGKRKKVKRTKKKVKKSNKRTQKR